MTGDIDGSAQSGSRVLRFPGSGILVPFGHGLDLHGCPGVAWDVTGIGTGAFLLTAGVAGTAGPGSSRLPVLQVQ